MSLAPHVFVEQATSSHVFVKQATSDLINNSCNYQMELLGTLHDLKD